MLLYELLAERKIEEAVSRGEFDDLPGSGQPLNLDDDDPLMPEELRLAYRILRNAGYAAPEVDDAAERAKARKKLSLLRTRIEARYHEKALAKLGR